MFNFKHRLIPGLVQPVISITRQYNKDNMLEAHASELMQILY